MSSHKEYEPFLSGGGNQDDPFDYVLVVVNPYTIHENDKLYHRKYPKAEAEKLFLRIFRTIPDAEVAKVQTEAEPGASDRNNTEEDEHELSFIKGIKQSIKEHLDALTGEYIFYPAFLELILKTVVDVINVHQALDVVAFYSRDKDEIFLKIRASEENLKVQADLTDYRLQFRTKDKPSRWDFKKFSPYSPFEKDKEGASTFGVSALFDTGKEHYFKKYDENEVETENGATMFRYVDRVRLVQSIINEACDLSELQIQGILRIEYPIHNKDKLEPLRKNWASFKSLFKRQPIQEIREYFGESIALYFAWLHMYIIWLLFPGVIGLILAIVIWAVGDRDDTGDGLGASEICILIFTLMIAMSSTLFDQIWVRWEKKWAWEWGMFNVRVKENQRPEFEGELQKDPVSGKIKLIEQSTVGRKRKTRCVSYAIIAFFIALVIAIVLSIFLYRATMKGDVWGARFCAFLNAMQIKIMNFIYKYVARKLTDWENHEVDTTYNANLASKLFLFQFVNSYNSLFYIAFLKSSLEGCQNNDCMGELEIQLSTIFVTNLVMNVLELGTPWLFYKIKMWQEDRSLQAKMKKHEDRIMRTEMTYTEQQSKLEGYETPMTDYMEMVIQYGYVVLFSASFTLTPLLAYILNIFEVRVDAYKVCYLVRRPYPHPTENIGIWFYIIQAVAYIGIVTNVAIAIFTAHIFDVSLESKWLLFLVIEHSLLLFKYMLSSYIPDTPKEVSDAQLWQDRQVNEKMYGKLTSTEDERKLKKLDFKPSPDVKPCSLEKKDIDDDNEQFSSI